MGFTPDSLERLAYDFGSYGPKGEVPEPTDDQVDAFREKARTVLAGRSLQDLDRISEDQAKELNEQLKEAVADLCQGHPTREELDALPPRYRAGFIKYLMGELMDPTPSNAALRRLPVTSNGVASPI